jgi:hypothetical protein
MIACSNSIIKQKIMNARGMMNGIVRIGSCVNFFCLLFVTPEQEEQLDYNDRLIIKNNLQQNSDMKCYHLLLLLLIWMIIQSTINSQLPQGTNIQLWQCQSQNYKQQVCVKKC